jgi:hypothetical protein
MQMQLPLFPSETILINTCLGVIKKEEMVYYLHNGSPIFCHLATDISNYRYITGQLIVNGLCKPSELSKALGIAVVNFQRYAKSVREKGATWFFARKENRGKCYKLDEKSMEAAQASISSGKSIQSISKALSVTEGALRYHIRTGKLKKRRLQV